ncbi:class I SAM-dependent methyltransferase [Piscinibacter koreensis]|uniref:Class I SAM-dependent methyltransferase n=1 Tax=Piscinibacter koreensis TaxID=2742824 RepID=A0A7Y6TVM2_9BURK|nr:class I SAM-dependent methyltransferase [Schlegelella koreensis]NUZ05163.1 class I SAM-dependent methyltransferase [Schlegelella koreensis]
MNTPDTSAAGFLAERVRAARYDGQSDNPFEVAGICQRLMPAGVRVLDVGCGTGSVTLIANRGKNNSVAAVEPDAERAAIANARGIETTCGFLDRAYFAERGRFDVIMSSDVLEHLPDPAAMLTLMREGLVEGGRILISVPNVAHWSVRFSLLLGNFDYAPVGILDATHLRWFTARTIRELVERAGFEVEAITVSAGVDLPEYAEVPWRWMPGKVRRTLIRALTRAFPRLFGCQHVLLCRMTAPRRA